MSGDGSMSGDGYPCETKRAVEAKGQAMEVCIPELGLNAEVQKRYFAALQTGETEGLQELVATSFAALHGLHQNELARMLDEGGFALEEEVFGKDGPIGSRLKANPRALPLLELNKQLGFTADQQAITPKARGESKRDVAVATHLDWIRKADPGSEDQG